MTTTTPGPAEWVRGGRRPVVKRDNPPPIYGHCTACGSNEVRLNNPSGVRLVENHPCPIGYGCEVCS